MQVEENKPLIFENKMDDLPIVTENYTLYNRTFYDLKPNTEYSFQLAIIYKSSFDLYHWPKSDSKKPFLFQTLSKLLMLIKSRSFLFIT